MGRELKTVESQDFVIYGCRLINIIYLWYSFAVFGKNIS